MWLRCGRPIVRVRPSIERTSMDGIALAADRGDPLSRSHPASRSAVPSMTSRTHGLVISLALGDGVGCRRVRGDRDRQRRGGNDEAGGRDGPRDRGSGAKARRLGGVLRKALAARPPAVPARARYTSVVLISPPGAMALPTPATAPSRPAGTMVSATVSRHCSHDLAHEADAYSSAQSVAVIRATG